MMIKELSFEDWGTLEYGKAYEKQLVYFNKKIANKTKAVENKNDVFFVEHPHVYTLGKSGDFANLIIPESFLKKIDASFYRTDRGGDITYHGFGQIVIYPIIDLSNSVSVPVVISFTSLFNSFDRSLTKRLKRVIML